MRVRLAAGVFAFVVVGLAACAASCLLTSNLDDLHGGAPKDSGLDLGESCDPTQCTSSAMVVSLSSIAPCSTDTVQADRVACRKVIHDICVSADPCCNQGGFGPVEFPNSTQATILCVNATVVYTAPWTEVTTAEPGCTSISQAGSRTCDEGVHLAAKKRGLATAIYQLVNGDGTATFAGFDDSLADVETAIDWSAMTAEVSGCTEANVDKEACTTAAHRYCVDTFGDTTGYGPVAWDDTSVTLACIY